MPRTTKKVKTNNSTEKKENNMVGIKDLLKQAFQELDIEFKLEATSASREDKLIHDIFGTEPDQPEVPHIFIYDMQVTDERVPFPMNFQFTVDEEQGEINILANVDAATAKAETVVTQFINEWHANTKIPKLAFNPNDRRITPEWFYFMRDMTLDVEFFKSMIQHVQITTVQCFSLAVRKRIYKRKNNAIRPSILRERFLEDVGSTDDSEDTKSSPLDEILMFKDDCPDTGVKEKEIDDADMAEFQKSLDALEFEPGKRENKRRRRHVFTRDFEDEDL